MPEGKPHLAILTKGSSTWMGGRHYTLNLTKLLVEYRTEFKFEFDISVLGLGPSELDLYAELRPQLRHCIELEPNLPPLTLPNRVRWKLKRISDWTYPRLEERLSELGVTFAYPISITKIPSADWIPDFQYLHFPDGSQDWEIEERKLEFSNAVKKALRVVLSSYAAEADCHRVFPQSRGRTDVFQFRTAVDPRLLQADPEGVRAKYNLPERFTLTSNQLIPTKNHGFVLEALSRIPAEQRRDIHVVFTGDIYDLRNPGFYNGFLSKLHTLGVRDNVHLLGLIPKVDQVQLLRTAHAYLQPSLFEGWNTTVEEARSLGKHILLSDIPVHREQAPPRAQFFDPRQPEDLAAKLVETFREERPGFDRAAEDAALAEYRDLQFECARDFLRLAGALPPVGPLKEAGQTSVWDERFSGRNGFDLVRLLLASSVVFEHAFVLVDGSPAREPLYRFSHGQLHFGAVAVYIFFAISGALVTRSFVQTDGLARYFAKRVARIFPGFLVATLAACIVFGLFATASPAAFFSSQDWPRIALQAVTLHQIDVSGILGGNVITAMLNTFWTIKYEFDCYIMVAILGTLGVLRPRWALAATAPILAVLVLGMIGVIPFPAITYGIPALLISNPVRWPDVAPFFIVGSWFYLYRRYVPRSWLLCVAGLIAVLVCARVGGMYWALLIGGVYAALFLALSTSAEIRLFGRHVDLSYGVYLYGWPVGQMILYLTHQRLGSWALFAIGLPVTFAIAFASWRFVEEPVLRLARSASSARRRKAGTPLSAGVQG